MFAVCGGFHFPRVSRQSASDHFAFCAFIFVYLFICICVFVYLYLCIEWVDGRNCVVTSPLASLWWMTHCQMVLLVVAQT